MRSVGLCAGIFLITAVCQALVGGRRNIAPGRYVQKMNVGGFTRSYILRVPHQYDGSKPTPFVIVLHGWTASAVMAEQYTKMADESEKEGFILAAPDGLGDPQGWNAGFIDLSGKHADEAQFISRIINKVEEQANVDPDRIYIAGHSNGAFLSHLLAAELGNRIAAIGAVAGTVGVPNKEGGFKTIPDPVSPVSIMMIHGKKDRMVQYDSRSVALLHGMGAMESARWWASRLGCKMQPKEVVTARGNVITDTFLGGKLGSEVTLISIQNGPHDWPGGLTREGPEVTTGVNAAELIWDFFKSHPKHH